MALFSFLKKEVKETPLAPPRPPAGLSSPSPLSALDSKLPKLPPMTSSSQTSSTAKPASLPPLTSPALPPKLDLPPLSSARQDKPALDLPPLPTTRASAPLDLPPLPTARPSSPSAAPAVTSSPAAQPAAIPPVIKKPTADLIRDDDQENEQPIRATESPGLKSTSARSVTLSAEFEDKPLSASLSAEESPPDSDSPPRSLASSLMGGSDAPSRPLSAIPRISVREQDKPIDPFNLPDTPPEPPVPLPKAPQPVKRENSRLAEVLDELGPEDEELPELTPLAPSASQAPAFAPQLAREVMYSRTGKRFLSMQQFEEAELEITGTEQHLHNLQAHNEKLGIIETHTKNELEVLVAVFEVLERHLLSMDDKLFNTEGEY